MNQYIISGQSGTGKTYYAKQVFDNSIRLVIDSSHPYDIIGQLYKKIIIDQKQNTDTPKTLIIDELNDKSISTKTTQILINQLTNDVMDLNMNQKIIRDVDETIENIIWIGTNNALVRLINKNLIYSLIGQNKSFNKFSIKEVNRIGNVEKTNNPFRPKNSFRIFKIKTK